MLLALGIFIVRLAFLMLEGPVVGKIYEDPVVAQRVVRGTIYDRNGKILAIQTPYWGVYLHLNAIQDLKKISEFLAPYVQMTPQQIQEKASHYTTYAQIKEKIDDRMVEPLLKAVDENKLRGQINVEKRLGRTYPAQFHASQTLGFINTDQEGIEGIELSQESVLNPYPRLGETTTYGQDIQLTLDLDIQYALDVQLQSISEIHDPDYAIALVLDAKNGDILGMSSYPWYDVNKLSTSTAQERLNHAVNFLYEPGSVFKLFSLASVLKNGQAKVDELFDCDGSYSFMAGNSKVTINCTSAHGKVDPVTMIAKSCNGAIVHWAMQTDPEAFYSVLKDFGFTSSYDIGLPSKAKGQIAPPSAWSGRSEATIAFGQELLTTALHLAVAATALGPSGELLQPHLILSRTDPVTKQVTYQRSRTVISQLLNPEVTAIIRKGMHAATQEGGTGTLAQVEGIDMGIKTGTAQLLNPQTNSYEDGTVLASSLALVPIDNPRYIIYVAAGNPKGASIWGSNIAGPAIKSIVQTLVSQGKLVTKGTVVR
jgi:cell division protein FtsI (penicillin-binding protein 3)